MWRHLKAKYSLESSMDTNSSSIPSLPSPPDIKPEPGHLAQNQYYGPGPGYPAAIPPGMHQQPSGYFNMQGASVLTSLGSNPGYPPMQQHSPSSSMCSPPGSGGSGNLHSLSTKHNCAICGDRASGKHYGVYSCEGCKGFFKRTVRKDLTYACRDEKKCMIDKRQRNRCQYCRYMKCLMTGMKREAVQEERQRNKEKEGDSDLLPFGSSDLPCEKLLEADMMMYGDQNIVFAQENLTIPGLCNTLDKHLMALVNWAKYLPHFCELPLDDQIVLVKIAWHELLIVSIAFRSMTVTDALVLPTGEVISKAVASNAGPGVAKMHERIMTELVAKFKDMNIDRTEVASLKAIILFNADAKGVQATSEVESLREKVYASLEDYCRFHYPDEPGRFSKLLLRLPCLRSISLKCAEFKFFCCLIGDVPAETIITDLLEGLSIP